MISGLTREYPEYKYSTNEMIDILGNKLTDKVKENIELEARITKKITRIDFENAIQKLKSLGFVAHIASGSYHLNINNILCQ